LKPIPNLGCVCWLHRRLRALSGETTAAKVLVLKVTRMNAAII
jgi:hypothetical protein